MYNPEKDIKYIREMIQNTNKERDFLNEESINNPLLEWIWNGDNLL